MNTRHTMLAITLALLAGNAMAAKPTAASGLLPVPANRIVGLWSTTVTAGPCLGGPTQTFAGASTFHAGGTLSETNVGPPTSRGPAQGIWEYQGGGRYKTRFQYYAYQPNGTFDGIREIRTTTVLNAEGTRYTSTNYVRFLNPDGTLRVELCGNASSERVQLD